jgi:hypothetical protein
LSHLRHRCRLELSSCRTTCGILAHLNELSSSRTICGILENLNRRPCRIPHGILIADLWRNATEIMLLSMIEQFLRRPCCGGLQNPCCLTTSLSFIAAFMLSSHLRICSFDADHSPNNVGQTSSLHYQCLAFLVLT